MLAGGTKKGLCGKPVCVAVWIQSLLAGVFKVRGADGIYFRDFPRGFPLPECFSSPLWEQTTDSAAFSIRNAVSIEAVHREPVGKS